MPKKKAKNAEKARQDDLIPLPVNRETILGFFQSNAAKTLKFKDIAAAFNVAPDDRSAMRTIVRDLVETGHLEQGQRRSFRLAESQAGHLGTIKRHPKGFGWFLPADKSANTPDAFIPPHLMRGLITGDEVRVEMKQDPKGFLTTEVAPQHRRKAPIVAPLFIDHNTLFVEPADTVFDYAIPVEGAISEWEPHLGDLVEIQLKDTFGRHSPTGSIVRHVGIEGELDAEIEKVLIEFGIDKEFPTPVIEETSSYPEEPAESDYADRIDLRNTPLVTIDGITAKDFDDAVFAEQSEDGGYHVLVAIADVSHYVRSGTALDDEAQARATSLYYPGRVIPMLPEALSNGLCSLNPDVNRLCMVADMTFDQSGQLTKSRFYEAVMRSHARLTYMQVYNHFRELDGEPLSDEEREKIFDANRVSTCSAPVIESLSNLRAIARILRKRRHARGAIDFDLPETIYELNNYRQPVAVHPLERQEPHKMIEDLMIATNEAVAEHFGERGWPCVYRIHEQPDDEKVDKAVNLVKTIIDGDRLKSLVQKYPDREPAFIQGILESIPEDSQLKSGIQSLILRAMMQAKYDDENVGHYGLASEAYAHFTSPIRRYPDLEVHRRLRRSFKNDPSGLSPKEEGDISNLALHCSERERKTTDVERAIKSLYGVWYLQDKLGEAFKGSIASLTDFGAFVRMDNGIEGLVALEEFSTGFVEFDPDDLTLKTKNRIVARVGDPIEVRVLSTDIRKRQIDLTLTTMPGVTRGGRSFYESDEETPSGPDALFARRRMSREHGKDGERSSADGTGRDGQKFRSQNRSQSRRSASRKHGNQSGQVERSGGRGTSGGQTSARKKNGSQKPGEWVSHKNAEIRRSVKNRG